MTNRLYLVDNAEKCINELSLADLNKWWTTMSQFSNVTIGKHQVGFLPETKSDFLIADGQVYFIRAQRIYKYTLERPSKIKFVTNSSDIHFNFLFFKDHIPCDDNIARSSLESVISSSPPVSLNKFWLLFAYMIDVFLIAICVYALKQLRRSRKQVMSTTKLGSAESLGMDAYVMQALSLIKDSTNKPRPHGASI